MELLATFYPLPSSRATGADGETENKVLAPDEREDVRQLVKNLVEKKSSSHRFPLHWLSSVARRRRPRALREQETVEMNQLEDLHYRMKKINLKADPTLRDPPQKVDPATGFLTEGSYHGLLPRDIVQIRGVPEHTRDYQDLNGRNVELMGVCVEQQPVTVELFAEDEPLDDLHDAALASSYSYSLNPNLAGTGVGSLVRIEAHRLLSGRYKKEFARLSQGERDALFAYHGCVGRVETITACEGGESTLLRWTDDAGKTGSTRWKQKTSTSSAENESETIN
ncbi:unnamed protein product, partial [Amoebophrya sp. A25]|eukprot:GSA25T00010031001.1